MRHLPRLLLALVALPILVGCGGGGLPTDNLDGGGDAGHGLVAIAIQPSVAHLAPSTKSTFTATGTNADGTTQDVTKTAIWSSSDPAVANVSGGVVSANSPGAAILTAKLDGVAGTAQVTVTTAVVKSIAMNPASASLTVGGTVAIQATATFGDGTTQDVTSGAAWSSLDSSLASVSKLGVATGLSAGTTTIVASFGGATGMTPVTVSGKQLLSIDVSPINPTLAPNTAFQLLAIGTYADGSILDVTKFAHWTTSAPAIVSVSAGGFANTVQPGTATLTATVGGVSSGTTVTVMAAMLIALEILAPDGALLPPTGVEQLQAIGTYLGGIHADLTQTVAWSSDAPNIVTVSNTMGSAGFINALVPGSMHITATLGNISGTLLVNVSKAKLGSMILTPDNVIVPVGTTLHYTATGVYNDGTYITLTRDVVWVIDDATVGTISNVFGLNGTAATVSPGKTMVHATFAGVTETTTLATSAAKILAIAIAPPNATIAVGAKQQLTATALYSDNSMVDVTGLVAWSTTDDKVATISNAPPGVLTATGPGNTTVAAAFDQIVGTTSVSVTM